MGVLKIDKKLEEKIQNHESDIVDVFSDISKLSSMKKSHLSLDKAKSKFAEISKNLSKLDSLIKSQEKLLEKWDAS